MNGGPELEPKLAGLLDAERRANDFPEERRGELLAKVVGALPGGGEDAPPAPGGGAPDGGAPALGVLGGKLLGAVALLAVGASLGYMARGAGATTTAPPPQEDVAPSALPAPGVTPIAQRPADTAVIPPRSVPLAHSAASPPVAPALHATAQPKAEDQDPRPEPSGASRGTLAQERSLVERARAAVARRDGLSALEALTEHERTFPNGKLAEERDAVAVQALALAGRNGDARRRAALFEQRYPGSIFTGRVEATLRELPP